MLFNINPSDVVVSASDSTNPTIRLQSRTSTVFGAVGPFSVDASGDLLFTQPISLFGEIAVGTLSPGVLARTDWSFGFIQAIALGGFRASWSGAKSNAGNVSVGLVDTDTVFPDFDKATAAGRAAAPFTRRRADRFKYDRGRARSSARLPTALASVCPQRSRT